MVKYNLVYKTNSGNYTEINWKQIPIYQSSNLNKDNLGDIDKFTTSLFQNEAQLKSFLIDHGEELDLVIANKRDKLWNITNSLFYEATSDCHIYDMEFKGQLSRVAEKIGVNNSLKNELKTAFNFYMGHDRDDKMESILKRYVISELAALDGDIDSINKVINFINEYGLSDQDIVDLRYYVCNYRPVYEMESFPLHIIRIERKPNSTKFNKVEVKEGIAYAFDKMFLDEAIIKEMLNKAIEKGDHKLIQAIINRYQSQNYARLSMFELRKYADLLRKNLFQDPELARLEIEKAKEIMKKFIENEVTYKGYNKNYPDTRRLGMTISRHLYGNEPIDEISQQKQFEQRVEDIRKKNSEIGYTKQLNFLDFMR